MQMEQIKEGIKEGIDLSLICNPKYDYSVMREIRLALKYRFDLTRYAKLGYSGEV